MDFLESIDKLYYYIIFGAIFIIGHFIVQRENDLKLSLKYYLSFYGILILFFSISIPHVFPGYPYDISDVENKKILFHQLQRNNEDVVKMSESIRDMAFMTFIFLSIIINQVIKYLKIDKSVE